MLHVTTTELTELEAEMMALIHTRDKVIRAAELQVRSANATFDREALPLARKINALRAGRAAEPTTKPGRRAHHDGLTDDEVNHYQELERKANNGRLPRRNRKAQQHGSRDDGMGAR